MLLSGWAISSTIEDLGFCKPLQQTVVAFGGSKSSTNTDLEMFSLYGRPSLPPARRNPQSSKSEGLGFFEPLWATVVASGGSKSFKIEDLGGVSKSSTI